MNASSLLRTTSAPSTDISADWSPTLPARNPAVTLPLVDALMASPYEPLTLPSPERKNSLGSPDGYVTPPGILDDSILAFSSITLSMRDRFSLERYNRYMTSPLDIPMLNTERRRSLMNATIRFITEGSTYSSAKWARYSSAAVASLP